MIPRVRHLAAAALSGALLMLPALVSSPALAAPADRVFAIDMARTDSQLKSVLKQWSPQKLAEAEKASPATPGPKSESSGTAGNGKPVTLPSKVDPRDVEPVAPSSGSARTFGKVFFSFGDKEYWCSASSIAAKNASVVATAGHCAYDIRTLKPASNWIFVPNPGPDGSAPDGIYVGASVAVHEQWPWTGDYDYDYAFVTVHSGIKWENKNGEPAPVSVGKLQDNVGGQGLTILRKTGNTVHAFGYPAGAQPNGTRPFDGRGLKSCTGATSWTKSPSFMVKYGVLLPCNFTSGVSGGPWLMEYNAGTKLGKLNGVNSLTWYSGANGVYDGISSPYFNKDTLSVYLAAAAA
ncbi:trypsin-like serine peptidase [Nonomuraea sp. NPDC050663]|uniref:trypsin-like serine peptidase n=1 Tax=Nonomuraea sp. NPDC050663 TaxID=3364370 RepID=UPI0037B39A40